MAAGATRVPARPRAVTCPSSASRWYASVTTPRETRSSPASTRLAGSLLADRQAAVCDRLPQLLGEPVGQAARRGRRHGRAAGSRLPVMDLSSAAFLDLSINPIMRQSQGMSNTPELGQVPARSLAGGVAWHGLGRQQRRGLPRPGGGAAVHRPGDPLRHRRPCAAGAGPAAAHPDRGAPGAGVAVAGRDRSGGPGDLQPGDRPRRGPRPADHDRRRRGLRAGPARRARADAAGSAAAAAGHPGRGHRHRRRGHAWKARDTPTCSASATRR